MFRADSAAQHVLQQKTKKEEYVSLTVVFYSDLGYLININIFFSHGENILQSNYK